jgi:hypothetical protein
VASRVVGSLLFATLFAVGVGVSRPATSAVALAARVGPKGDHLVIRSSRIRLDNCSGSDVTMRASIPLHQFPLSQPVTVTAVLRNRGNRTCTYNGGGTRTSFGPCGSFPMDILNKSGVNVWPGPVSPSCPSLGQAKLRPGGHVVVTGIWPQTTGFNEASPAAPPGRYRLVVDTTISFTIVLK